MPRRGKAEIPNFRKCLARIQEKGHRAESVYGAFVCLSACALALQTREDEYMEEAKRWKPDELNLFAEALAALVEEMETKPYQDVLGEYYQTEAQSKGSRNSGGEFYTPHSICQLMARMVIQEPELKNGQPYTILDPCIGHGGQILAAAEHFRSLGVPFNRMMASGVDISKLACDACYINLTLWGIPATIVWGNALTMEHWKVWQNIHWFEAERIKHMADLFMGIADALPIEASETLHEQAQRILAEAKQTRKGQYIFDLEESA